MTTYHSRLRDVESLRRTSPWLMTREAWTEPFRGLEREHMTVMEIAAEVIQASLRSAGKEIFDKFITLNRPRDGKVHTFIHSDVHLGTWYKTGDGRMGLCDWKCCNIGPTSRDFVYGLSTLLEPADRAAWDERLVCVYIDQFTASCGIDIT